MLNRHKVPGDVNSTDNYFSVLLQTRGGCLNEHILWGDLFIVVYSICDKYSFMVAEDYLEELRKAKGSSSIFHALLLGNKRDLDLDHTR